MIGFMMGNMTNGLGFFYRLSCAFLNFAGTCIAFYVVIGDLAPPIVANITGMEENDKLRLWLLILVGVCCVLPLSLLRHLDSLSYICQASMGFYTFLVCYISYDAIKNCLFSTYWYDNVVLWQPAGIFQW